MLGLAVSVFVGASFTCDGPSKQSGRLYALVAVLLGAPISKPTDAEDCHLPSPIGEDSVLGHTMFQFVWSDDDSGGAFCATKFQSLLLVR